MKLKFVPGMGEGVGVRAHTFVCVCVCLMPKRTHAEVHNTNTQAAGGFNQFPGVRDKSCLVHVSPPAGPV